MKIKLFANYHSTELLLKRFLANYDVYDNDLVFTKEEDYDFAVVFNKTEEKIKSNTKIITVIQEPSWSKIHENNSFLTVSDYLLVHDQQLFENVHHLKLGGKVLESPSYMFYHDPVPRSFYDQAEATPKTKKISIIVSSLRMETGNYGKRLRLLRKIIASDLDIDIYGRGLNIPDTRFKGKLEYKHAGLLPYEYSIALENSNEKNYITEKFVDCALCNTIPIYSGAPNIDEVYNKKYYHTLDLDSPTVIDDIKQIISNPVPEIGADNNKKRYFEQFNLYTKLKEIVLND